jgi:hypothetical protein
VLVAQSLIRTRRACGPERQHSVLLSTGFGDKQIESENERLAELNAKLRAILFNSAINSNPTNPTLNESEM